ncbi:MAG: OmpH family outer membrane protein [Bacteroidales bacterium]|jgi:outer membrane protein|nr:OmpH family outer membrane protein [Bacteroidales bacterium]MDD4703985.1 OmpH family outer membrane protein [Bacteroidales bacterium]MDX9798976.1 OmpH family outer membrane protein [Bacteroidales bacterium]
MKKTIQALTLIAVLLLCTNLFAQKTVKLGHFSSTELIKRMPEGDSAQATMTKYMAELQEEAETMQKEYERLMTEYQAKEAQLSDVLKQSKQREIQSVGQRFQEFQQNAQDDIQRKQGELMLAITDKIRAAVTEIAKENKYTYIFESTGILWYSEDSEDITPLLVKKLNLK